MPAHPQWILTDTAGARMSPAEAMRDMARRDLFRWTTLLMGGLSAPHCLACLAVVFTLISPFAEYSFSTLMLALTAAAGFGTSLWTAWRLYLSRCWPAGLLLMIVLASWSSAVIVGLLGAFDD